MGGIISNNTCVTLTDDVIVLASVVTSELSLSSCVVAQITGKAASRLFNRVKLLKFHYKDIHVVYSLINLYKNPINKKYLYMCVIMIIVTSITYNLQFGRAEQQKIRMKQMKFSAKKIG